MQCPKCGAENQGSRASCWNCFAQLGSSGDIPAKPSPKKVKPVAPPEPEPNPVAAPEEPALIIDFGQTSAPAEMGEPDSPEPQPNYIVPGLAETTDDAPEAPRASRETNRKSSGGKKFPVIIPVIIVLAALVAAWWFLLANPSPEPVAKQYISAMQAVMSGDTQPLQSIVSASSQSRVASMNSMSGMMKGLGASGVKLDIQKVDSCTVTGDKAEVMLSVKTTLVNMPQMGIDLPMSVALVREGSPVRRKWKVDLDATNQLQAKSMQGMIKGIFPKGMPSMPGGMPPGMPQMPGGMPPAPGR